MHGRSRESSQTEWQDIAAAWADDLAYDPGLIRAPLASIRGAWESLITDTDARWLFEALRALPIKRNVKISRATHLMHLEESRYQLYREAQYFLEDEDTLWTRSGSSSLAVSGRV